MGRSIRHIAAYARADTLTGSVPKLGSQFSASGVILRVGMRGDVEWVPLCYYADLLAWQETMPQENLRWYRVDEQRFALATAQHAGHCLEEARSDWEQLPWAIIALHNAVQAALISHLNGTAGLGALERKCAEQTLAAMQGEGDYPREFVANFAELIRRAAREEHQIERAGGVVALSAKQRGALRRLNVLRNNFIHFSPKGWSVEISGLPEIALACAAVARSVRERGWALRNLADREHVSYDRAIVRIEDVARSMLA